ncbi:hypothetical protein [Aquipuribacter sp. MA13-6]|uniref:hypothetical protein n=1 Tax=unclassified Aquipuribacter TaxID=2635084 RepID=UPI003EEE4534
MSPKLLVLAVMTTAVMASAGGCNGLPGGTPTQIPTDLPITIPTALPSGVPTVLPEVPVETAVPPVVAPTTDAEAAPAPTVPAPVPSAVVSEPAASASAEPGLVDAAADAAGGIPWWGWLLLVLAFVGLVAAILALRRARASELAWAAQWHELTGEARWLDERVVPAVQDRALDPSTLATRWQDGAHRFDDLDRRVWAATNEEQKPARAADLNALSEALLRLRDALDTEVALRTSGVEQPGLPDAAQTVADARDELRRTVTERTR